MDVYNLFKDLLEVFLFDKLIYLKLQVILVTFPCHEAQILRDYLIKEKPAQGCVYNTLYRPSVRELSFDTHPDLALKGNVFVFISQHGLVHVFEGFALTGFAVTLLGKVINTQDHILRRNGNRCPVRRLKKVVGRKQQESALRLSLYAEGKMGCHLVAVEVGIVRRTYQRMQLYRTALHEHRLKCLDAQSVKSRRTVKHYRMLLDDFLKHIPDLRLHPFHHLLGGFYIVGLFVVHKLFHYKWLEKLNSHFLGQTALVYLKLGSYDYYRSS